MMHLISCGSFIIRWHPSLHLSNFYRFHYAISWPVAWFASHVWKSMQLKKWRKSRRSRPSVLRRVGLATPAIATNEHALFCGYSDCFDFGSCGLSCTSLRMCSYRFSAKVRDSISYGACSLSAVFACIPETIRSHFQASCLGCSIPDPSSIYCCPHFDFFQAALVPHHTCFSYSKASFFLWTCPACVQCCFAVRCGVRTCSLCHWVQTFSHGAHSSFCALFSSWVACSSFALQWQPCATSLFVSCRLHMRAAARRSCIWVLRPSLV